MDYGDHKYGATVDFAAGSRKNDPRWSVLGKAVISEIKFGRVKYTIVVIPNDGKYAGKKMTCTFRDLESFKGIAPIAKVASKVSIAKLDENLMEKQRISSEEYKKNHKAVVVGNIVKVTRVETGESYEFYVCAIDYSKDRARGYRAGTKRMGGKAAYFVFTTPNLQVELIKKSAFNPDTCPVWATHKAAAQRTADRRTDTRQYRQQLRDLLY